jgi:hypothetical protein
MGFPTGHALVCTDDAQKEAELVCWDQDDLVNALRSARYEVRRDDELIYSLGVQL